jgi:hypothetical protein
MQSRFRVAPLFAVLPFLALLALLAAPLQAHARDLVSFGSTVVVPSTASQDSSGNSIQDVVCAFCTVEVHGPIQGDLVTAFSSVKVDSNLTIGGDAVSAGTNLTLGEDVAIHKDLVFFGGRLEIPSSVGVNGDRVVMDGTVWTLVLLAPFLIMLGLVWLFVWFIVWLVRRNRRYAYPPPGYPPRRA